MREVKLDSRKKMLMDCHALQGKARNDRKMASFLTTPQDFFTHLLQRILGFAMRKQGCAGFFAEISLDGYRTRKIQAPCFIAQSRIHQPNTN